MGMPRRRKRFTLARLWLVVAVAVCCILYWRLVASLIRNYNTTASHELYGIHLSKFEVSVPGELRSERTQEPPANIGECAINLYGLPQSFKHHVLPSLIKNVITVNKKYQCDYFVHFFNATVEASGSAYARGGYHGKLASPEDIYLLEEAAKEHGTNSNHNPIAVRFVSDTNHEFARDRKPYIDEIVYGSGGNQSSNPYFVQQVSFTEKSLWNILTMWHSQDRVWNLMEESMTRRPQKYTRVAMLRLDVVYTMPIDVYKVPTNDTIPPDHNTESLQALETATRKKVPVEYFYDTNASHCVLPFFKSFPVNGRYFVGPYTAAKIWAKDRFSRAHKHVFEILPKLEAKRDQKLALDWDGPTKFTGFGLHDERFVAHSLLPQIRQFCSVHADRELYFVRVWADGSMWLRDKPGLGRVKKRVIEAALGRKCMNDVKEVIDPVLKDQSPGRWQLKCPRTKNKKLKVIKRIQ